MTQPTVYITRRIPIEAVELLKSVAEVRQWDSDDPISRDVLLREVADVDALFPMITERIDEGFFPRRQSSGLCLTWPSVMTISRYQPAPATGSLSPTLLTY